MSETAAAAMTGDGQQQQQQMQDQAKAQPQGGDLAWLGDLSNDNEMASFVKNKGWDGVGAALKSYRELEKYKGNGLQIPRDDATPEQWSEFYGKLGRPQKAEEYKIEGLPEGFDDEFLGKVRGWAHGNGLTPKQLQGFAKEYVAYSQERQAKEAEAAAAKIENDFDAFRKSLGAKEGEVMTAIKAATKFSEMTEEEVQSAFQVFGVERFGKLMHKIGAGLAEHKVVDGKAVSSDVMAMSPEAAQARIDELNGNAEFRKRFLANDPAAIKQYRDLNARAAQSNAA